MKDKAQSSSITPELIRKNTKTNPNNNNQLIHIEDMREYEYEYKSIILKRFSINPEGDNVKKLVGASLTITELHDFEKKIFQNVSNMQDKEVLLGDIFVREHDKIKMDSKTKLPETHTVCLWNNKGKILIIDPSTTSFSAFLPEAIKNSCNSNLNVEIYKHNFKVKNVKDDKFYVGSTHIGRNEDDSRDCIDVAVKIGFILLDKNSIDDIKFLSNQKAVNKSLEEFNGTYIRELQSSNPQLRDEVIKKIENPENNKHAKYIIVDTLSRLNALDHLKNDTAFKTKWNKYEDLKSKKVYLENLDNFEKLHNAIEQIDLPELKHFPHLKLTLIETKLPETVIDKENQYTLLHEKVQNGDFKAVKQIAKTCEMYYKISFKELSSKTDQYGQTVLHWAAGDGYEEIALYLIENMEKKDVIKPATGHKDYTALHLAIHSNSLGIVQKLVEEYPELLTAVDKKGQTALHWAAGDGYEEIALYLIDQMLEKGMREAIIKPVTNNHNFTTLHLATQINSKPIVEKLVEACPELLKALDKYGQTALHWAAGKGFVEIVHYLIDKMVEKGMENIITTAATEDNYNFTALHLATQINSMPIVKMLVEKFPILMKALDISNRNALHWAVDDNSEDVALYLLDEMVKENIIPSLLIYQNKTVLHLAVDRNSMKVVKKLVENCPELLTKVDNFLHTALHNAAENKYIEVVTYLIEHMDPIDIVKPQLDYTVLHCAVKSKSLEVVKAVIEGAKNKKIPELMTVIDMHGQTALHWAAKNGYAEIAIELIENMQKDDILKQNSENYGSCTALIEVVRGDGTESDKIKIVKKLIDICPEILKIVDENGQTALHWAANDGYKDIAIYLIKKMDNEDIVKHAPGVQNSTVLHLVTKSTLGKLEDKLEIIKELIKASPNLINVLDQNNQNALQMTNQKEIIELLNPTGIGLEYYENENYWNKYSRVGMEELLQLRFEHEKLKGVEIFVPKVAFYSETADLLAHTINQAFHGSSDKLLVPLNLYNKHWVGLVIEKDITAQKITINYMDSEQQSMPKQLILALQQVLTNSNENYKVNIKEAVVELQKYNNCGPETIENMVAYFTNERFSQEEAVEGHSFLLEKFLLGNTESNALNSYF